MPPQLTFYELLSGGAVGWVYKINDRIAVKYASDPESEQFKNENAFFDILASQKPCPDIIKSFLRVPRGNFLAFMAGGNLEQRLQAHQTLAEDGKVEVSETEPEYLTIRWLSELCSAVAWLETLGYVHGDLRPPNLLLDSGDHLKLADFDCVAHIGTPSWGAAPPWARVLGVEAGDECGTFGTYGARTEQFAIGSILYCLTRGHEPFERDDPDIDTVDLFQRLEFPELSDAPLDVIIGRCWKGDFASLGILAEEVKPLRSSPDSAESAGIHALDPEGIASAEKECQQLLDNGLLDGPVPTP